MKSLFSQPDSILSVQNVSKKFCRNLKRSYLYGLQDIFSEVVGKGRQSDRLRNQEFWAVKNVSLEVKRGESIGLVGVNGSGKSTLLRMVSGLIKPDTGRIVVRSRVAALTALGTGFNPLLSGRENVFINMAILGISQKNILARFDDVVNFAEIWDAIDSPVRTYSSGMRARLGFAAAIFTDPDILLLDEVLAVGDARFRSKCYRQLAQMREQGTAFLLVSHNANAVLNACNTAVFLAKGKVVMNDSAERVISCYEEALIGDRTDEANRGVAAVTEWPVSPHQTTAEIDPELAIEKVTFIDQNNEPIEALSSGEAASICIHCKSRQAMDNVTLNLQIHALTGGSDCVLNLNSERDQQSLPLQPGLQEIRLKLPYCGLSPNLYRLKITLSRRPFYVFDMVESFRFEVKRNKNMNQCQFYQPREWQLINHEKTVSEAIFNSSHKSNSSKPLKPRKINARTPLPYDLPYRIEYAERIPVLQTFRTALLQHYARESAHNDPLKKNLQRFSDLWVNGHSHIAAECGVYVGSSLVASAEIIRQYGLNAHIYGLDSFVGLPKMTAVDEQLASKQVIEKFRNHGTIFDDTSLEQVYAVLQKKGLGHYVSLVPGFFKDTLSTLPNGPYFFMNLDCDLYEGHLECLEFFYPRMEQGGIIFFDDYNSFHYPMAKAAIDKFMKGRSEQLFQLRYGPEERNHTKAFIVKH